MSAFSQLPRWFCFPLPIASAAMLMALPVPEVRADAVADFTEGNTFLTPDQYPGMAGNGWLTPWGITLATGQPNPLVLVEDVSPILSSGNYLKLTSSATNDTALGRRFDGTGSTVDINQPVTMTFDVRIDDLTGWDSTTDYITVHANNNPALYNVSNASSFIIRAYGASPAAGKPASEWLFFNTVGSFSPAGSIPSGMAVAAGTTYSFTVTCHPATKTYDVSINNGTSTVSQTGLNWRSNAPSNIFAVNHRMSAATDVIGYSLDNVVIQANVSGQPDTAARFDDGNTNASPDQWTGAAGNGWDGAWLNAGAVTATVVDTDPIAGSGNYLEVAANLPGATSYGREFDSTGFTGADTTLPVEVSFDVRIDELGPDWNAADDTLTFHATNVDWSLYNVTGASTYIIRAFGASPGPGLNANEWLLYDGGIDNGVYNVNRFRSSGMPVSVGSTYDFTIHSNPATKRYNVVISDGVSTVRVNGLGWRSTTASDRVAFTHSLGLAGDNFAYSLDNLIVRNVDATDYEIWSVLAGLTGGPGDDDDGDGVNNADEYVFGLNPKDSASFKAITAGLDPATGEFSYRRRDDLLSELDYTIWTSTDLVGWTKQTGATQDASPPDAEDVQFVDVTLPVSLLESPSLFVRVQAD